jgi:hypothetical protein
VAVYAAGHELVEQAGQALRLFDHGKVTACQLDRIYSQNLAGGETLPFRCKESSSVV